VETGFAKVVGTEKKKILASIESALVQRKELPERSPFSDGSAAERIAEIIQEELFA
jgi:UDP-N-acetylglucosamine 2-epimerase